MKWWYWISPVIVLVVGIPCGIWFLDHREQFPPYADDLLYMGISAIALLCYWIMYKWGNVKKK